jgi:hypothetical protein
VDLVSSLAELGERVKEEELTLLVGKGVPLTILALPTAPGNSPLGIIFKSKLLMGAQSIRENSQKTRFGSAPIQAGVTAVVEGISYSIDQDEANCGESTIDLDLIHGVSFPERAAVEKAVASNKTSPHFAASSVPREQRALRGV